MQKNSRVNPYFLAKPTKKALTFGIKIGHLSNWLWQSPGFNMTGQFFRDKLLESRGLEPERWKRPRWWKYVEVSVKINRKHAVCVQTMRIENTVNPNFRRKPAGLCLQNERWPFML